MTSKSQVGILDKYTVIKKLSKGSLITVKLVSDSTKSILVVCKILKIRPVIAINAIRERFSTEIALLKASSHDNIIKILDYSENSYYQKKNGRCYECMYYITEYCPRGNLLEYILNNPLVDEEDARQIFVQIMSGLVFIHGQSLAHGDIRLENFVIGRDGTVKMIDFGFSKRLEGRCKEFYGSNYYMAPEILNKQPFFPGKADVFAAGCVLFSLVFRSPAFFSASMDDELYRMLCTAPDHFWDYHETMKKTVSPDLKFLIQKMLNIDPNERYDIHNIVASPWFNFQEPEE
jgi:serine/threonine protein kinase